MIVVPGPSSPRVGERVAQIIGAKKVGVDYKNFPDGESYIRLTGSVRGEEVLLVHTTYPQPDKRVLELLLLIDTLKDLRAAKIKVVVPYMAYSRQDTRFRNGEAVSINTIFRLIEAAGADEFYTIDIHKECSLDAFKIKAKNLHATEVIADHIKGMGLKKPYILSPDKGALDIAKRIGKSMGVEYGNLEKTRDRITGVITVSGDRVEVEGRDVVITDDLISTGGTIANACKILKDGGARRVIAVCTHPLIVEGAYKRMKGAGLDEVLGTDTVDSEVSKISVAPLIAKEFR